MFANVSSPQAIVYLHALSARYTGPFGWSATIIDDVCAFERGGVSCDEHFTRLLIVGTIEALNVIPSGSEVSIICSDKYLKDSVFGRLDPALEPTLRKADARNLDLFPALRSATAAMKKVSVSIIPAAQRDEVHAATAASAKARLTELRPVEPQLEVRPVASTEGEGLPW